MRLIDADALRERLQNLAYDDWNQGITTTFADACNEIIEIIEEQPTAEPSEQPEIIRCKDCENWIPGYITDNDDFIPPKCGKYQQMVGHNSNDYCSLAERRTDE